MQCTPLQLMRQTTRYPPMHVCWCINLLPLGHRGDESGTLHPTTRNHTHAPGGNGGAGGAGGCGLTHSTSNSRRWCRYCSFPATVMPEPLNCTVVDSSCSCTLTTRQVPSTQAQYTPSKVLHTVPAGHAGGDGQARGSHMEQCRSQLPYQRTKQTHKEHLMSRGQQERVPKGAHQRSVVFAACHRATRLYTPVAFQVCNSAQSAPQMVVLRASSPARSGCPSAGLRSTHSTTVTTKILCISPHLPCSSLPAHLGTMHRFCTHGTFI